MLLTFIEVLSHVSTFVTGGDPALYLNKMLQSTEVVRPLVGESSTSVAQQQQFKLLLGGGGEGGGVASPVVSRGGGGASEEKQLPRASKQSAPEPETQFSTSPTAQKSSKRQHSTPGIEEDDMSSKTPKKALGKNDKRNVKQEEQEEQDSSLQRGKLQKSSEASAPHGHLSSGGSGGKGKISSKEGLQEVQETPSFDDLLTQAINAVNRPLTLASTAASALMSSVAPSASGPAAGSAASPSAIPAPPPMPTWPAPTASGPAAGSAASSSAIPTPPPMPTWPAPAPTASGPAAGSAPSPAAIPIPPPMPTWPTPAPTASGPAAGSAASSSAIPTPPPMPTWPAPAPTASGPAAGSAPSPSAIPIPPPMPTWPTPAPTASGSAPTVTPPTATPSASAPTPSAAPSTTVAPPSSPERQNLLAAIQKGATLKKAAPAPSASAPTVTPTPAPSASAPTPSAAPSTTAAPPSSPERQSLLADIQKGATLKKAAPVQKRSTPQDEIKKSQFALKPTPTKEVKVGEAQPTPEPQEPARMKKSDLGKKSETARAGEELLSQTLHTLELEKDKLIKEEEWQRANNPKFNPSAALKELKEIEGKIAQIKSQMQAEGKSSDSSLADVGDDTSKKTTASTPAMGNLMSQIQGGVKLKKSTEKTNEEVTKEPKKMDSGAAAVLARRVSIEDDYDTDSDDDSWLENNFPAKPAPVQPIVQPKKEEAPTGLKGKFMSFGKGLKDTGKKLKDKIANKLTGKKSDNKEAKELAPSAAPSAPPPVVEPDVVVPVASPPPPPAMPDLPVQPVKKATPKFAKKLGGEVSEGDKGNLFAAIQEGPQLKPAPELQKKKDPTTDLLAAIVKGTKLKKNVAPPQVQPQEKKKEDTLSKAFSSVADSFFSKLETSDDSEAETKKKLPLSGGSDSGFDSDDDDWD